MFGGEQLPKNRQENWAAKGGIEPGSQVLQALIMPLAPGPSYP